MVAATKYNAVNLSIWNCDVCIMHEVITQSHPVNIFHLNKCVDRHMW